MPFIVIAAKAPDASAAALASAGAGNVDNGTHSYKVTFVTALGETEAGTVSNIVTVADKTVNGKVALTSIPTGDGTVTQRKIYRTVAGDAAPWKLLTTLADNTTTTYTDNTADASLGANAPSTNGTGLTVEVARDEAERDTEEIGDRARAIDGTYRATRAAFKHAWPVRTPILLRADADTLDARLKGACPMSVTGDLVSASGATVQCYPEITEWHVLAAAASHRVRVGFTLHEA
jgi:hypothetical protein